MGGKTTKKATGAARAKRVPETLRIAAMLGDVALVEALLAAGADPSVMENGLTPLHVAAMEAQMAHGDHVGVARVLLDAGVEVDARSSGVGFTPLFYAAGVDAVAVVELLLARGADPRARVQGGETPLHEAARSAERAETIVQLVAAGAARVRSRRARDRARAARAALSHANSAASSRVAGPSATWSKSEAFAGGSRLTHQLVPPTRRVASTRPAAGCTRPEVPIAT